jgi:hypothetical protein
MNQKLRRGTCEERKRSTVQSQACLPAPGISGPYLQRNALKEKCAA